MRRGSASKRVDELERTLAGARQQIERDRAEIVELERAISSALAEQEKVVEREASGDLTPDKARKTYDRLTDAIAGGRRDRDRLRRVVQVREDELAGIESQLERARFDLAFEMYEEAATAAHEGSKTVAGLLRKLEPAVNDLARLRSAVDSAKARADELRPRGLDLPDPATLDEPAWAVEIGLEQLAEQIAAGPRHPVATSQRRVAQQVEDNHRSDASRVDHVVARALSMPPGEMRELAYQSLDDPELQETARELVAVAVAAPRPEPVPLPAGAIRG